MTRPANGKTGSKAKSKANGKTGSKAKGKKRGPTARKRRNERRRISVGPFWLVAVLVIIAAILALPYLRREIHESGAPVPELAFSCGEFTIDISHYQKDIIWDSLMVMTDSKGKTTTDITRARRMKPVTGVVIKASEGRESSDPCFAQHWEGAAAFGIRRGAYHFYRSSKDPVAQARNFIKTVGPLRYTDLPPVLDVETIHPGCSRKKLNEGILTWLRLVEKEYSRKPVLYSSESFLKDYIAPEILADYPVWVAHYGVEKPLFESWRGWQFTDRAVVYGVEGKVDLSVFR